MRPDSPADTEAEVLVLAADLAPLADEVAEALKTPLNSLRALDLATRVCRALEGREDQLWPLEERVDGSVCDWLAEVPLEAARAGLVDEALTLTDDVEPLLGDLESRAARARVLGIVGRRDEARRAVEALLADHPEDADALDRAGEVLGVVGDAPAAEAHTRRAIALTIDPYVAVSATERLIGLVRARGAHEEAEGLVEQLQSMRAELDEAENPSVRPPSP